PRRQAAEKIERQESQRSHPILDVVAEEVEKPHVADDVEPPAVQKHRGQERPVVVRRKSDSGGPRGVGESRGDQAEEVDELLGGLGRQREFPKEQEGVDGDQSPDGEREVAMRDRVAYGYHRSRREGV